MASKSRRKSAPTRAPLVLTDGSTASRGIVFRLLSRPTDQMIVVHRTYTRKSCRDRKRRRSSAISSPAPVECPHAAAAPQQYSRDLSVQHILRRVLEESKIKTNPKASVPPPVVSRKDVEPAAAPAAASACPHLKKAAQSPMPWGTMQLPAFNRGEVERYSVHRHNFEYYGGVCPFQALEAPGFGIPPNAAGAAVAAAACPFQGAAAKPKPVLKQCACCGTQDTPLWRDIQPRPDRKGQSLCNACGIRFKKYSIICQHCSYVPTKQEHVKSLCVRCLKPYGLNNTPATSPPAIPAQSRWP